MEQSKDVKYLVMVDPADNHNKFYRMIYVHGESFFHVEYGRVGARAMKRKYPISSWSEKYREKIAKGYCDQSDMITVNVSSSNGHGEFADIEDPESSYFVTRLLAWAGEHIKKNYSISVSSVTPQMVVKAQNIINTLRLLNDTSSFNNQLNALFTVLPRKMTKVSDFLCKSTTEFDQIIDREQKLLDVMAAEVDTSICQSQSSKQGDNILEAFGLDMRPVTDKEMKEIKDHLGSASDKVVRAFYVRNNKTEERFQRYCKEHHIEKTKFLYHGSMNENFWNIYKTGLVLRSGAKQAGKMFGIGLYFASEPKKSLRYTSLRGCNNIHGNTGNTGVLAVFKVATGNAKHISVWSSEMSSYTERDMENFGTNSVYAHKGASLINDEMIVYNEAACTIRYMIEVRN